MAVYDLTPVEVPHVNTKYRTIRTKIPVPESLPIFKSLESTEPVSMRGQPPIIWHKAQDFTVEDRWGNRWIDWSSCVLVSNAGHGRKEIRQAIQGKLDQGLIASYVFVHEGRATLTKLLQSVAPSSNYLVFLLSSGSEAVENCIKLSKTYAREKYGPSRKYIVSFGNAFQSGVGGGNERHKDQ